MDDNLNILFLLRKINCNDGIASYSQSLAEGLKDRGAKVFIVSGPIYDSDGTKSRELYIKSSVADWLAIENLKAVPSFSILKLICGYIKKNNISVINVHGLGMLMWGRVLSYITGLPLVATYHPSAPGDTRDPEVSNKDFTWLQKSFLTIFVPERLIVLSQESKSYLLKQCRMLRGRIVIIPGGIDTKFFRLPTKQERNLSREKFKIENDELVCTLIGRLTWNKGHDLVIAAAREVSVKWPGIKAKYFFVGHGEHEADIRALVGVDASSTELFHFLGYVDDIREVLWASDIFLLPSRLEGFALVIAEAMSAGVVPVRTPSGGAMDQISSGENGFIVPFENAHELASAIYMLSFGDRRVNMARNASDHAQKHFSRDSVAEAVCRIYASVIAR